MFGPLKRLQRIRLELAETGIGQGLEQLRRARAAPYYEYYGDSPLNSPVMLTEARDQLSALSP